MTDAPAFQIRLHVLKRFVLMPGYVGDKYVGAAELIRRYQVPASACVVAEVSPHHRAVADLYRERFYVLRPRADGCYDLRLSKLEQT